MSEDKDIGSIVAWAAFDESGAIQPWAIKDSEPEVRELILMVDGPQSVSNYSIRRVAVHWRTNGREVRDVKAEAIIALEERVRQLELENETLQSIVSDYQERFYDQRSSEGR